ncbi:MAG: DUF3102 domain-containing protein [Cyanobacteria bacterium P01_A01_bin.135]
MNKPDQQVQPSIYFDYDSLGQTHRAIVQEHTGEIRKRLRRSAQDVWEIGQRLADVRSRLQYGQFLAWLKAEFGWSQRTAYNFINVYETFGDRFAKLATLDIATSVLYQLASPSLPEDLRNQVLDSVAAGKKVTNKALKSAIKQHKQPKKTSPQPSVSEEKPSKPEIITVIPKAVLERDSLPLSAQPKPEITVTPGWYRLADHRIFCGDTASQDFIGSAPAAKLAVAATDQDWAHDWLVDQVDRVVILPEEDLTQDTLKNLLLLLSKPRDQVIFPWLPLPEMIAVAHRLGRDVYGGDPSAERCQRAIAASGLTPEPLMDTVATAVAV